MKRPQESDDDEDTDEDTTPKRVRAKSTRRRLDKTEEEAYSIKQGLKALLKLQQLQAPIANMAGTISFWRHHVCNLLHLHQLDRAETRKSCHLDPTDIDHAFVLIAEGYLEPG